MTTLHDVIESLAAPSTSPAPYAGGALFEAVVQTLSAQFYDRRFRAEELPGIAAELREKAQAAQSLHEERQVVHALLRRVPASHLGLMSRAGRDLLIDDLFGRRRPTLGLQLLGKDGALFASMLLEGGPAERAGVTSWDHVLRIDGVAANQSPRLDWRTDDAFLDDDRDPPMHLLLVQAGEKVTLTLERRPGEILDVQIAAEEDSSFDAARRSVRVIESGGRRLGYVHFWLLHMTGAPELLRDALTGDLADCDALLLDLRGRGGNAPVVAQLLRLLSGPEAVWNRPVVALIDRQSRSGKDVLAYELRTSGRGRLVGEPTAGAAVPATFADVGSDSVLMFPSFTFSTYSERLELKPTDPDVAIERAGPYSAGADPILEAGISEALRQIQIAGPPPPLAAIRPSPTPPAFDPAAFPLPAVDDLLTEMVQALGGAEALRSHSRMAARGTVSLVDTPVSGPYEIERTAPNLSRSRTTFPGVGTIESEFDGQDAWETNPGGVRSKAPAPQALAARFQSLFYGPLQYREVFSEIRVEEAVLFDQKPCYRLSLTAASGDALTVFIDAQSKRLAGRSGTVRTPVGEVAVNTYIREHRLVEGVYVPTRFLIDVGFQKQEITVEEVTLV